MIVSFIIWCPSSFCQLPALSKLGAISVDMETRVIKKIINMLFCTENIFEIPDNNNRFLYSAFPNYDQSASQCIITPVIGFSHNSALRVHFLHSLGSIPASRRFTGAHNANSTTITFASYRVPIYTPGWRAAMWIKCLAEGQKCRALTGIEPGTL